MPTQIDALSMVYARSLFELAESAGGREKVQEVALEMEQIAELARENRSFAEFLASPVVDSARRAESLKRIFANRITDLVLRFLLVLNEKHRLSVFARIADAMDQLVQEAFGRVEVDVFTAAPLGPAQLGEIRQRIQQALGKEPVLHPYTDELMIGGIKLRIGDQLIDGSVASQLRRMRSNLLSAGGTLRENIDRFISD